MRRRIAAIVFIFVFTTWAWAILAATILARTHSSDNRLQGRVTSTRGSAQEQSPPIATYEKTEESKVKLVENNKVTIRTEKVERTVALPLDASMASLATCFRHCVSAAARPKHWRLKTSNLSKKANLPSCHA